MRTSVRRCSTLMRLDLLREARRWPEPEYRFKHALIQEAAYRTLVVDERRAVHAKAATWLEDRYAGREEEVASLLAHHWLAAADEDKAVAYLTMAGDRARQEYALDEAIASYRELLPILGGARRAGRDRARPVQARARVPHVAALRGGERDVPARVRPLARPEDRPSRPPPPSAWGRASSPTIPTLAQRSHGRTSSSACSCSTVSSRRGRSGRSCPSLAERWEISDDGLRYVFHLREGLTWSDGEPLTAHDVEFGIKRVLNPDAPGSSVAIYFVLEHGQDHYLRTTEDPDLIGVRALDDRTVEFRLAAPAPYFMSVMNRPDGGPQPRHAIERDGDAWTETGKQVVSGAFEIAERHPTGSCCVAARTPTPAAGQRRDRRVRPQGDPRRDRRLRPRRARRGHRSLHAEDWPTWSRASPATRTSAPRAGRGSSRSVTPTRGWRTSSSGGRSRARSIARRSPSTCPRTSWSRTAASCPRPCKGTRRTSCPRFDPDAAREHLRRSGCRGTTRGLEIAGIETWLDDFLLSGVADLEGRARSRRARPAVDPRAGALDR